MLDAEVSFFLDLLEKATAAGRPKLSDLPVSVGRPAVDRMSCEGEADPPDVARVVDGALPDPPARSPTGATGRWASRRRRSRPWSTITVAAS